MKNTVHKKYIGIDVGGTKIYGARFSADTWIEEANGQMICTKSDQGMAAVIADIKKMIGELKDSDTVGVGIGFPGLIDYQKQIVLKTPNIKMTSPLKAGTVFDDVGLPIVIDNDVNLIALAEHTLNYPDKSDLLVCAIGTGIGGGIIINGDVYRGAGGFAGEFGHAVLDNSAMDGAKTFENLCSGTAIKRRAGMPGKKLVERVLDGDLVAVKLFEQICKEIGAALSGLIHIFNPSVIVIGGSLSNHLDLMLKDIWATIKALNIEAQYKNLKIVAAKTKNAGALGAAVLARKLNQ